MWNNTTVAITRACWGSTALLGTAVIRRSGCFAGHNLTSVYKRLGLFTQSKEGPAGWWQLNQKKTWSSAKIASVVLETGSTPTIKILRLICNMLNHCANFFSRYLRILFIFSWGQICCNPNEKKIHCSMTVLRSTETEFRIRRVPRHYSIYQVISLWFLKSALWYLAVRHQIWVFLGAVSQS